MQQGQFLIPARMSYYSGTGATVITGRNLGQLNTIATDKIINYSEGDIEGRQRGQPSGTRIFSFFLLIPALPGATKYRSAEPVRYTKYGRVPTSGLIFVRVKLWKRLTIIHLGIIPMNIIHARRRGSDDHRRKATADK